MGSNPAARNKRTQSDIGAGRGSRLFGRAAESVSEAFGTLFVLSYLSSLFLVDILLL
jgi:hypothetical protein